MAMFLKFVRFIVTTIEIKKCPVTTLLMTEGQDHQSIRVETAAPVAVGTPEPFSMIGSALALGGAAALKRRAQKGRA